MGYTKSFGEESGDFWLIKTDEYGTVPEFTSLLIPLMLLTATALVLAKKMKPFHKRS